MDVRTENPFWLLSSGTLKNYSSLNEEIETEFAVIGVGISGALVTWHLAQLGIPF